MTSRPTWHRCPSSWRYTGAATRWRRGRQSWAMGPAAERHGWAGPGAFTPGRRRSRWRVGCWAGAARFGRSRWGRGSPPGNLARCAAPSRFRWSVMIPRGPSVNPWRRWRKHGFAACGLRRRRCSWASAGPTCWPPARTAASVSRTPRALSHAAPSCSLRPTRKDRHRHWRMSSAPLKEVWHPSALKSGFQVTRENC